MPDLPSQEPKKNGPSAPNLSKGCLPAPPIANITTPAGIKELLDHSSVELASVEPTVKLTDTEQDIINTIIGEATIVGMGEACHWHSHEAHQVKDKVFRYLVQEKGFRVFALEDSREACKEVDRCLKDTKNNLSAEEITKKFGFGVWWTKELSSVIAFIKKWNKENQGDMISVIGIDANDLLSPVHSLKRHCESSTDELKKLLGKYEGTIRSAMQIEAAPAPAPDDQDKIKKALNSLGVKITEDSDKENTEVPKSSIPTLIKEALKKAQVNTENPDIKEALPDIKEALEELDISLSTLGNRLLDKLGQQGWLIGYNYRDEKMYKFLSDHIKNRADHIENGATEKKPTEKIFLWAHNHHIAKATPDGTQIKPLGQCIHEDTDLSAKYKNIGFCHNFTYIDSDNQSQDDQSQDDQSQNVPPQNVPSDSFEGLVLEYGEEKNRIINLSNDVPIPENSKDISNKTEEPVMIALYLKYNYVEKVIWESHAPAQLRKCLDGIIFLKNANTNNWLA